MKKHYVLLGESNATMTLYSYLRDLGIDCTLAPTPRSADHCCGVCILYFRHKDKDCIEECAKQANVKIDLFYDVENEDDPNRLKFC